MTEIPKQRQEYFNRLKKAMSEGDEDASEFLTRGKSPLAVRSDVSTMLGQHMNENYDDPLNAFANKDELSQIPVTYTKDLPPDIAGRFVKGENGIYTKDQGMFLGKQDPDLLHRQMGIKMHEYGHPNDIINKFEESQPFDKIKNKLGTGLSAAEEAIGKHHASGFFEKEALMDLLKNKKLAMALPLIKAAGVGALGYQALGIGQKAMAGDVGEASMDAADMTTDFIPGVGEAKMAISPTQIGNAELPPEVMEERERFNKTKQKLRIPQPM